MSALSIRNLPRDLEKSLIREARRAGKTKTEITLEALRERLGLTDQSRKRAELRQFFGRMSEHEFQRFREATKPFSEIEPELWD